MNKYKICVYAICKNEAKFIDRWLESVSEADYIVVLDTGSTDNSVEKFKKYDVTCVKKKKITPWRFDVARNEAMKLIPKDTNICFSIDMDEVVEKGWREKLEKAWSVGTKQARYRYTWNFLEDGREGNVFWMNKIHAYGCFKWTHPVHEVLEYIGKEPYEEVLVSGLQLNHFPDVNKSRGNYLKLLEMAVKEDEKDARNMHYLGREYMYNRKFGKCIHTLKKHLKLKNAVWKEERAYSMRYIGISYYNLNEYDKAVYWLKKATKEAPNLREPYVDLAMVYQTKEMWNEIIENLNCALQITEKSVNYFNESFAWQELPHDLLAIAYFNIGNIDKAIIHANQALLLAPNDMRINENSKIIHRASKKL